MNRLLKLAAVLAMGSLLAIESISPAAAFVGPRSALVGHIQSLDAGQDGATVTDVRFRGRGFGGRGFARRGGRGFGHHRGFRGRGYGYGGGYDSGIGVGALAAGALIGGAIAASQTPAGTPAAYCASRFKSYNPSTGTYTGYDGQAHPCP